MKASACSARAAGLWLALLLAIAAFIRVDGAGDYHYNADETMHADLAKGSGILQVMQSSLSETHPPIGNLMRHCWQELSANPAYMRAEGLLFSLALIMLYYRMGALLGGRFSGLCCAALAAFSHGAIVQSYLLRNYAFFLFFLSGAFYYYLLWRERRDNGSLLAYTLLGALACLTHFSGIFACFSIALYETAAVLLHRQKPSMLARWILANGIIAGSFVIIFAAWYNPVAMALNAYLSAMLPADLWKYTFIFPPGALDYTLPYRADAGYSVCMFVCVVLLAVFAWRRTAGFRPLCILTATAFAVGMILFASGHYPFPGGRHSLWIFPFIITATGWALADALERRASRLHLSASVASWALPAVLLLAGVLSYSPAQRFADKDEYSITQKDWQALTGYLGALDYRRLIIADRGDMFLLDIHRYNPYRGGSKPTLSAPGTSAVLIPYGTTHLLYNAMRAHISDTMLLAMVAEADKAGLLRDVDTLVFLQSAWTAHIWTPVVNLMLCDDLDKQVVAFPAIAPGHSLTREEISAKSAVLLILSKQAFFDQAMRPQGKAHHCLGE